MDKISSDSDCNLPDFHDVLPCTPFELPIRIEAICLEIMSTDAPGPSTHSTTAVLPVPVRPSPTTRDMI